MTHTVFARRCVLGVDIGSTNIKAMIVDDHGKVCSHASAQLIEYNMLGGWVEQDPEEIYTAFCQTVNRVVKDAPPDISIMAMALDSNRCGLLALDAQDKPLCRLMTWRDVRSEPQVQSFVKQWGKQYLYDIGGEYPRPQHSVFKIMWLRENRPDIWKQCTRLMFSPKEYVLQWLTGRAATSTSMAQSTGLFNIGKNQWEQQLLRMCSAEEKLLPDLLNGCEQLGLISDEAAAVLGLPAGLPVAAGFCDATAGHVGTGAVEPGDFSLSIGTCGAMRCISDRKDGMDFAQMRYLNKGVYVPSCTISDAGGLLRWYKDTLCPQSVRRLAELMYIDSKEK